jgi:hypothetical protein
MLLLNTYLPLGEVVIQRSLGLFLLWTKFLDSGLRFGKERAKELGLEGLEHDKMRTSPEPRLLKAFFSLSVCVCVCVCPMVLGWEENGKGEEDMGSYNIFKNE